MITPSVKELNINKSAYSVSSILHQALIVADFILHTKYFLKFCSLLLRKIRYLCYLTIAIMLGILATNFLCVI